nr:site-specific DNA-methyltransferase [uncultured Kingella sp.]
MIYIDPPYNTGSDSFIYPDKFAETREEYARRVGDKDDNCYLKRDGIFQGAWRKNSKDDGHYHSKWLSMMLPRLHLARTLLRDDGVIFISIDDNEQAQLKLLCDEVFGAENFVGDYIKQSKVGGGNDSKFIVKEHEFCLVYAKSIEKLEFMFIEHNKDYLKRYKESDEFGKYFWDTFARPGLQMKEDESLNYPIPCPDGSIIQTRWIRSKERFEQELSEGKIRIMPKKEGGWSVQFKQYLNENGKTPRSFTMDFGGTTEGDSELKELFNTESKKLFPYPKSTKFIKTLFSTINDKEAIILDFFSGSGTTAHAVMQLNAEDGGNRRYLCVQLPEETDEKSEARKAGFATIADIAKERIRRAGKQVSGSLKDGQSVDTGFKVFKLAESNFKQWRQPENIADLGTTMEMFVNAVQDNALPENMLYELMLRLGCKLTSAVEHKNGVYWVIDEDTGKRIALLLEAANQTLIDDVITAAPAKVVALDKWFDGNDALKSNTVLQMKDAGIVFECV